MPSPYPGFPLRLECDDSSRRGEGEVVDTWPFPSRFVCAMRKKEEMVRAEGHPLSFSLQQGGDRSDGQRGRLIVLGLRCMGVDGGGPWVLRK